MRDAIEGHASPTLGAPVVPGIRGGAQAIPTFGSETDEFEISVCFKEGKEVLDYCLRVDAKLYRVVKEELRSSGHPGHYVFTTHPDSGPLEQRKDEPVLVARFYKGTRGLNPRREFSPYEFVLSQFRERRAESRINEIIADRARRELSAIQPLELQPEILRQYSSAGYAELGEHGEHLASVIGNLIAQSAADRQRRSSLVVAAATLEQQLAVMSEGHGTAARQLERRQRQLDAIRAELAETERQERDASQRLAAVKAWLSELAPRPITDLTVQSTPTGELIASVVESGIDEPINARSLSDGTLRFAALSVAMFGLERRRTLVIEEVENGINPARLAVLMTMLEQATHTEPDLQVIASTHSPGLLDFCSEVTAGDAVVIGWDSEKQSSHPVRIRDIAALKEIGNDVTLGALQAEGWLQLAAAE